MSENVSALLAGMSGRKIGLIGGVVVIVILAAVAIALTLSESKEVLFNNLQPEDAATIAAELEHLGVDYQLAEGGAQILVDSDQVGTLRLRLMETGMTLAGGVGYELFDNSDFGMTEFAQKVNHQRALEGELSRTIGALRGVRAARVHLALPDRALFAKERSKGTAAVTLFIRAGMAPNGAEIRGIQRLVAASVPAVDINDVAVLNQHGVVLSQVGEDEAGAEELFNAKASAERYFREKLLAMLADIFGGDVVVSVDVTLDAERVKRMREQAAAPDDGAYPVARKRESRSSGGKDNAGSSTVTSEVEYELGRFVEEVTKGSGSISRISVGVLIKREAAAEEIEKVRDLVAMTIGYDASRGDGIAVRSVARRVSAPAVTRAPVTVAPGVQGPSRPASGPLAMDLSPAAASPAFWLYAGGVLLSMLMVFGVARAVRRRTYPADAVSREAVLRQIQIWLEQDERRKDSGSE